MAYMSYSLCVCIFVYAHVCNHPEVDRIWAIEGISQGSFEDHIPSTARWLYMYST